MKQRIKDYYKRRREIILYAVFGVATTLANLFAFLITTEIFGEELVLINNAIAWIAGVVLPLLQINCTFSIQKAGSPKSQLRSLPSLQEPDYSALCLKK